MGKKLNVAAQFSSWTDKSIIHTVLLQSDCGQLDEKLFSLCNASKKTEKILRFAKTKITNNVGAIKRLFHE